MKNLISFLVGIIFALGLGLSGMTQPHIVRGFLDIFGSWDWRLMGVMFGAIAIHAVTYRLIIKRPAPILAKKFYLPTSKDIDYKLILGAALFGLGWGWVGICPGPGIVNLAGGDFRMIAFVLSMLVGMKVFQIISKKFKI